MCGATYGKCLRYGQHVCGILFALLMGATGVFAQASGGPGSGRGPTIVVLGDSLTAGYGLPESAAFPAVLQRKLAERGRRVTMVNAGVSGDTTSAGLARLDWSVPDGTDGVIVELGANDMLRGLDPATPRKALNEIVTRLKARNIPVMLAGMYASRSLGEDYVRRFEAIYPDLAREHGVILYPFFMSGVTDGAVAMTLNDRVHPSAAGVRTIVERILPTVETFLDRIGAGAKPGG